MADTGRPVWVDDWGGPIGDLPIEVASRLMGGPIGRELIRRFNTAEMTHYRHALATYDRREASAVLSRRKTPRES